MPKPSRTPREEIERAFHVSFKLPEQATVLLDNYRDQVLTEAAELVEAACLGGGCGDWGRCTCDANAETLRTARTTKEN